MAPQKEFESPTFRLGGGRSILLSYWGICYVILLKYFRAVKKLRHIFSPHRNILSWSVFERSVHMYFSDDPNADLDDLIFEKDDGGPSER